MAERENFGTGEVGQNGAHSAWELPPMHSSSVDQHSRAAEDQSAPFAAASSVLIERSAVSSAEAERRWTAHPDFPEVDQHSRAAEDRSAPFTATSSVLLERSCVSSVEVERRWTAHTNFPEEQPRDEVGNPEHQGLEVVPESVDRDDSQSQEATSSAPSSEFPKRPGARCCGAVQGCSLIRAAKDFPWCSAHCPITFAILSISLLLSSVAMLWPGLVVNTDFSSFLVADGRANELSLAWESAKEFLGVRQIDVRRLAFEEPTSDPDMVWDTFRLRMMYAPRDGGSMFNLLTLREMLSVELELRSLPGWRQICNASGIYKAMCEPGYSVANAVWLEWPEKDPALPQHQFVTCNVTGKGRDPLDLDAALALLQNRELVEWLFPKGYTVGDHPEYLSSNFHFRILRGKYGEPDDTLWANAAANEKQYMEFLANELYPTLNNIRKTNKVLEVYWSGDRTLEHAVATALKSDSYMALGSASFIVFYLAFHTRSLLLSVSALLLTMMGIPLAFVSMALLTGSNGLTGASFLSLFLIIGLGADVVLVFASFWHMSKEHYETSDYVGRIKYLYRNAGSASLATSMTTACSFFANLASVLRPLREFGFFMGLCIIWTYCCLVIGFPPVLLINERLGQCCSGGIGAEQRPSLRRSIGLAMDMKVMLRYCSNCRFMLTGFIDKCLIPCRRPCFCFFVILPIAFSGWTATLATAASGSPQIFPKNSNEHSQNAVGERFPEGAPPSLITQTMVCNMGRSTPGRSDPSGDCGLNWCDLEHHSIEVKWYGSVDLDSGNTTCECKPVEYPSGRCKNLAKNKKTEVSVHTRLVGAENLPDDFWLSKGWQDHIKDVVKRHNQGVSLGATQRKYKQVELSRLVQMHWESGMTQVVPYLLAPQASQIITKHNGRVCGVSEVCYCGTPACRLWEEHQNAPQLPSESWTEVQVPQSPNGDAGRRLDGEPPVASEQPLPPPALKLGSAGRQPMAALGVPLWSSAQGRRLSSGTSPVHLVWGLTVSDASSLLGELPTTPWRFDVDFRPEAPSVQRHLMSICREIGTQDLLVAEQVCWVKYFRDWLYNKGMVFPARGEDFHSLIDNFAREVWMPEGGMTGNYMWFGPDGRLKATYLQFMVEISQWTSGAAASLTAKLKWDSYVDNLNLNAPVGADEAWHNSPLWIRAEAEQAILSSTLDSMILSGTCGFLGALVSTHFDFVLSIFALLAVVGVTLCLAWFICVALGWAIGAIEVLGLIIFVGYSITYSIHIAHKYREGIRQTEHAEMSSADRRASAVRFALTAMTSAIIGSAVTTLGASFFLFFCTINIFVKVASILFAVTFFAAIYSVIALPAALLIMGPVGLCSPKCVSLTIVHSVSDLGSRLSRVSRRRSSGSSDGKEEVAERSSAAAGGTSEVVVTVH